MSLYELDRGEYDRVKPLFKEMEHNLILYAATEGTSPGKVYVDNIEAPRTAFLCTVEGYYLLGDWQNTAFNQRLSELILQVIFKGDRLREGENEFTLYYHPHTWEGQMEGIFSGKYPLQAMRRHYTCQQVLFDWRSQLPPNFHIVAVDAEFLRKMQLVNIKEVRSWINTNWNSEEEFLQMGRGFCTIQDDRIVSWCITDCVSGKRAEVGITTDPAYRGRGLATITAAACVDSHLSSGMTSVGWHCPEQNLGSRGVAEKVGFILGHEYPIVFCVYDDALQLAINGHFRIREQQYTEALGWYDMAILYDDAPGWAYYDAACALTQLGELNGAMERLYQALDKGWNNLEHTIDDEDLKALHGTVAWQGFISDFRDMILNGG
jgi:RimJ/RimL family protein N-acetyltransferase